MATISGPAIDDANPLAAAANNGARAPGPAPAANNFDDPDAALSTFDVVHGTTTATGDVGAGGTTSWWSSPPPYYAGSGAHVSSSSFPPPPPQPLRSHDTDLACYAGTVMDTSFPQLPAPPPAVYMQPELSPYLYYPQEPQPGFPSCFAAAPMAPLGPTTIRPELQVPPTTQPASMAPALHLHDPQTQATTTGSESVVEGASPALADTQRAREDDARPAPRRRGRPSKRALAVSELAVSKKPTKRVAVESNRTASSSSSSQRTSSAATVPVPRPDQAGASSSSTGSTSGQETAACTGTDSPMASAPLLCEEQRCQLQQPDLSNGGAPAGVVVEGHHHHHQQAAIAPPEPEATVTGPPQYADTSAVGVRFQPKDEELLDYLTMKYSEQQMPVDFFKEFDVYEAHPTAIKGACGESQDGCWYAFSRRDRKYKNGKRPARSVFAKARGGEERGEQVGFWKSNSKLGDVRQGGRKDGAVIGRMTSLTFQVGRQPRGKQTGWKMKEYTIPENQHQPDGSAMRLNDWVVCKLFYKERPNTESKKDENATSVGQEGPMQGKSEEGKIRPRRSRKSKRDKNAVPVAFRQEGEAVGDGESVQGDEDMPQMVPAAHQVSDYSEQDLSVEDYLVSDVAFAQQNDAANVNCVW